MTVTEVVEDQGSSMHLANSSAMRKYGDSSAFMLCYRYTDRHLHTHTPDQTTAKRKQRSCAPQASGQGPQYQYRTAGGGARTAQKHPTRRPRACVLMWICMYIHKQSCLKKELSSQHPSWALAEPLSAGTGRTRPRSGRPSGRTVPRWPVGPRAARTAALGPHPSPETQPADM
jgi:hypothetical protein